MKRLSRLFAAACLLSLAWLASGSAMLPEEPAITVIANEKGAPSTLTMRELKAVLEGQKQRWGDGSKISIAFMKASTPVGNATASKVMRMTGDQLNKFWLALVFQGKAKAPVFFTSAADLENYVSTNTGAIGVIDGSYSVKHARVVSIDGKRSF
jgi:ABC-type phosphate transport system substrate-binding protein